jgi:hypothetical protein
MGTPNPNLNGFCLAKFKGVERVRIEAVIVAIAPLLRTNQRSVPKKSMLKVKEKLDSVAEVSVVSVCFVFFSALDRDLDSKVK